MEGNRLKNSPKLVELFSDKDIKFNIFIYLFCIIDFFFFLLNILIFVQYLCINEYVLYIN